jgi:hypothetical protein
VGGIFYNKNRSVRLLSAVLEYHNSLKDVTLINYGGS